ncbi:MAG: heme ABC transporter ATP-binding protein [Myxococcota bacterium]
MTDCLRLDGAGYQVDGAILLDQVSFEVHPGQITVIVGPNGAGKSTCLALASGAQRPTSGRVELDGQDLRMWERKALALRRAVVTQQSELAFAFSVLEVVLLGRHPHCHGLPGRSDVERCMDALRRVDMDTRATRSYTTLSGGERQRVQVARSLVQLPDEGSASTWLLDEPSSALDIAYQHRLMKICREEAERSRAVLMVLHDLDLALRHADQLVLLKSGRIHAVGRPEKVLTPDNIQAVYGVQAEVHLGDGERPPHVLVLS